MTSTTSNFAPFSERMQAENLPEIVIKTFEYYYNQLVAGHSGLINESDIVPVESLPDAETFPSDLAQLGESALPKTILLKLNGGLGTSMGLEKAKSVLTVKNSLTFLDIIARQAMQSHTPLVLMNSFNTQDDSLEILHHYPGLTGEMPLDFLQHKVPKVNCADYTPVDWPQNPELEWCPPGHGDIYTALITSGMLETMLNAGYEYAFVSNVDNLGAVVEPAILGYFVQNNLPFMMEVADRTPADRKGGHLAQLPNGQLILRESAQCPDEDMDHFQDITRHRYFNTNNLWINLIALKDLLTEKNNILGLAMIRNKKTVDPRDSSSPPVYQLETAMGAAIAVFKGSGAVRVPRTRFAPVKTTDDLLAIRSDAFTLTSDYRIIPAPQRTLPSVLVSLDPAFYRLIDQMEARFPYGPPSLVECREFSVTGDIKFGKNIVLKDKAVLVNETDHQVEIKHDTEISGRWQP